MSLSTFAAARQRKRRPFVLSLMISFLVLTDCTLPVTTLSPSAAARVPLDTATTSATLDAPERPPSSPLSSPSPSFFDLPSVGFHDIRTHLVTLASQHHSSVSSYSRQLSSAETYLQQGYVHNARKLYQQVIGTGSNEGIRGSHYRSPPASSSPDVNSLYSLVIGYCSAKLSLYDDAEQEFQQSISSSRSYAYLGYTALGMLQLRQNFFTDALKNGEMSLIYRDNYFPSLHMIGSIAFILGDIERGIRMYTMALRVLEEINQHSLSSSSSSSSSSLPKKTGEKPHHGKDPLKYEIIPHILQILSLQYMDNPYPDLHQTELTLKLFLSRIQTIDLVHFHRYLGLELINTGAFEAGQYHLRKTISLHPSDYGSMLLFVTLAVPFVYSSVDEIYTIRAELVRNVREALEDRATVTHPEQLIELYYLTHQLPYMGLPSHLLMKDITRLFASSDAPVLSTTSIDLYRTYPYTLAHATGNARWETFAPYRYQDAPHPPPGAYVRQSIHNYFITNRVERSRDSNHYQEKGITIHPKGTTDAETASTTVIKIGILSYQIHDCPVGNLLYHLMVHLRGYAAAYASVLREEKNCVPYSSHHMQNPSLSDTRCTYIEAPSQGGGTQPRYLRTQNLSFSSFDWTNESSTMENDIISFIDPMMRYGYVSIPGVVAFNVTLFRLHYGGDNVTRRMNTVADHVVMLPSHPFDLEQARNAISREHMDVLIASDPGIQPEIYSLLFARMAPIQIVYWGVERAHTLSLGLPDSIDYYIVGDESSDDQLQEQIQEQVVRLGDLGLFASAPSALPTEQEKFTIASVYNLLETRHMYLLPVTLNALHPSFDNIIVGILRKDGEGEILCFYDDQQSLWLTKVQERLRNHPFITNDIFQRIRFTKEIPSVQKRTKWSLMASVEVVLDTYPVSIGYDAIEAFNVGTPVVTMNNLRQTLRSYTIGALQRMDIPELLAGNESDYIDIAVRIASDVNFRKLMKQKITGRRASYQWFANENLENTVEGITVNPEGESSVAQGTTDAVPKGKSGKQRTRNNSPEPQPWRHLPRYNGKISDSTVSLSNRDHLQRLQDQGYNDPKLGTLNDWVQFLGNVGRPYAEDREATELEIASSLSLSGKPNQKGNGPKGFSRTVKNRKKLNNDHPAELVPSIENEIVPSEE